MFLALAFVAFLYLFVGIVVFIIFSGICGLDLETSLFAALTWPKLWWDA